MNQMKINGNLTSDDDYHHHSSSNNNNLLTRTTIREANTHLQMLHARNQQLEQIVNEKNEEIHRKDQQYADILRSSKLLERHCQQLQELLDDRTKRLHIYERKEDIFRETLELRPAIESLLDVLNTYEQEDRVISSTSTSTITNKPLQFIQQPSAKEKQFDR